MQEAIMFYKNVTTCFFFFFNEHGFWLTQKCHIMKVKWVTNPISCSLQLSIPQTIALGYSELEAYSLAL